jgi:uncharacterized protein
MTTNQSNPDALTARAFLEAEDFDEIDAILDEMRSRYDETPQWEFCEGFMAAVICSRRTITASEYLQALLGVEDVVALAHDQNARNDQTADPDANSFADAAQKARFMELWHRRWEEVRSSLDEEVDTLEDERCYHPEVTDIRGAIAEMPPEESAAFKDEALPAFAQVWALGFMFAVEYWPEDWVAPRDKDAAKWLDGALQAIVAMTEDDEDEPEVSPMSEDGPPSVSIARLNAFGEAIWAVYDLRELWKTLGARVETVRVQATPGRNDICPCNSGKKYKKCCGR